MSYSLSVRVDFKRNTYPGLFIALEGLDGSGKTVQIAPLTDYLRSRGKQVVLARAPRKDEGILAVINKQILNQDMKIPMEAFQYLFTADYIIQMEETIIPALKRGDVVLTDRFVGWSAVAYGLFRKGKTYDTDLAQSILLAHGVFTRAYQIIIPDITFFLDTSVTTSLRRLESKGEKKEVFDEKETLKNVKKGYTWLLNEYPQEFTVIDAERSIEEVTQDMIKVIEENLSLRHSRESGNL